MKIAIIGAGNMGASIAGGLIATGYASDQITISDQDLDKLNSLHQKWGIKTYTDNEKAIEDAEVVLFAVKPQIFSDVAQKMAPLIQQKHPLLISVAAGITQDQLQSWFDKKAAIVRCMPNTPALIRAGMTALYANPEVTDKQRTAAEKILQAVGSVVWLEDESQMDAVTALSGSGPAYFFLLIEILQNIGQQLGLSETLAEQLTLQTALGAARMATETKQSASTLRQQVTSKGGTTEAALTVLENGNLSSLFYKALDAAKKRSEELGVTGEKHARINNH